MHLIDQDRRGLKIITGAGEGSNIRLTSDRVFAQSTPWHGLGEVWEHGLPIYTPDNPHRLNAYTAIDPPVYQKDGQVYDLDSEEEVGAFLADGGERVYDLDTWLEPVYTQVGGTTLMTPWTLILNHGQRMKVVGEAGNARWVPDPNFIGVEKSGLTTGGEWEKFNPEGRPYTKSLRYEVVNPRDVFALVRDILYRETSMDMKAHSGGALGKDGSKGVWASIPLPEWNGDVMKAIGSEVDSYMTFFIDPMGLMYVVETSIMTVCYNTWMMALEGATRRLKVGHQLGAYERLGEALQGIWTAHKESQHLTQEIVMHLRDQKIEREQAALAAQALYPLPGRPDAELKGKMSLAERKQMYERNVLRTNKMREAFLTLYENPQQARAELGVELGIGAELEGTAFAAAQTATFLSTYDTTRVENDVYAWVKGGKGKSTSAAIEALMRGGELEDEYGIKVTVSGVGYPQAVIDAYSTTIKNGTIMGALD